MKLILKVDDKKAAALIDWLQKFEFVRILSAQHTDDPSLTEAEKKLIDQRVQSYLIQQSQLLDWKK